MKKTFIFFLLISLIFTMVAIPAQLDKLKAKIVDKILKSEPVLTTNLDDATTEVPFLDDYHPSLISPLRKIPTKTGMVRYLIPPVAGPSSSRAIVLMQASTCLEKEKAISTRLSKENGPISSDQL